MNPSMDNGPMVAVRGLTKSFRLHAVDGRVIEGLGGVDLDVAAHTHVCLAGPSGAGKSSLLRCIHRTYVTDEGSITYRRADGQMVDLARLDDSTMADLRAAEIGYVSQFLRAEPRRGVLDVVTRSAVRRGRPPEEARDLARRVLHRVNIEPGLFDTYPSLLSGGEKQRVNLAAGIVVAPRLLLLDEPISALDPANREAVLDVIAELTSEGATVISVFHDHDAIARLADQVVLLVGGRVAAQGPPAEVLGVASGAGGER